MDFEQKILIVDDWKENLAVLRLLLQDSGATIYEADSGYAALALSLDNDFALAILDVQMPEMDGFELANRLCDDSTRLMPVIFISGACIDDLHVFKGYQSGCFDYIAKPYKPDILLAKVRAFLKLDRQRQELEHQRNNLETLAAARTIELHEQLEESRKREESLRRALHAALNPGGLNLTASQSCKENS